MSNTLTERTVLEVFKITPTDIRAQVLLAIRTTKFEGNFSAEEILSEAMDNPISISRTSLTNILRLFVVRGLLDPVGSEKTASRGRPPSLFRVSEKTRLLFR